jgi:amino acid transporter
MSDLRDAAQRPASPLQTMRAVAWSFLGIRRSSGYAHDVQRLNPIHVVIGGIVGAVLFVGVIVMLVSWVVSSGVAT